MHKDPPPGLLERPPKVIILFGLLTGFVAGIVVIGTWTLFSSHQRAVPQPPATLTEQAR